MKHFIITGHSRGLGEGITRSLLKQGHVIHGISRNDSAVMKQKAAETTCGYFFYPCNLAMSENIEITMDKVFDNIRRLGEISGLYLVNNAGIIEPIGRLETLGIKEIERHLNINLLAPVLTTREFVKLSEWFKTNKRVINISSGAAVSPYHGWSIYCTGKAGLDMFTRCVAEEQKDHQWPVEVMSIAPGIIDTDMQSAIRQSPNGVFIHKEKFVRFKERGQLVPPEKAGEKIAEILLSEAFSNGEITDIRDLY